MSTQPQRPSAALIAPNSESLPPEIVQRVKLFRALISPQSPDRAVVTMTRWIASEHVSGCLCETICLDPLCDCLEDAHLDPDCAKLQLALLHEIERAGDKHG